MAFDDSFGPGPYSMVFLGAGAAWASTYSLTDITPTGGWNCDILNTGGNSVTDNGDVAGWANTASNYRPFLYTNGTTTNLYSSGNQARAYGIATVGGARRWRAKSSHRPITRSLISAGHRRS